MAIQDTYFYDAQVRRYLIQFIRIFSNMQYKVGSDANGTSALLTVPVSYADTQKSASAVLRNNSENALISTPQISVYIESLDYNQDRSQDPVFIDKKSVRQRTYDDTLNSYTSTQANAVTVERHMPVPYDLTVKVDIWTTNTVQKLQILEQILPLFNPSLDLQQSNNVMDWTSLTVLYLEDTNWSSNSIPIGQDDSIDISTLTFKSPIWLSLPAKVKKLGVIQKVIANMYDEDGALNDHITDNALVLGTRQYVTIMNYGITLIGNEMRLTDQSEHVTPENDELGAPVKYGADLQWASLIDQYGTLENGIGQVRLLQPNDSFVVGTIAYHPTDPMILLFTVDTDTIAVNTLAPVDRIVDPKVAGPGAGLDAATLGQRYLIIDSIGSAENTDGADAWKGTTNNDLIAEGNSIIEYNGTDWVVSFDPSSVDVQHVTNIVTGLQYKWDGSRWIKSYEGEYSNGEWSLVL